MDRDAANAAFAALYPRLVVVLRRRLRCPSQDAEDEAVQEALCLAFARVRSKVLRTGVAPPLTPLVAFTLRDLFMGVRFAGAPPGVSHDVYGPRVRRPFLPRHLVSLDGPVTVEAWPRRWERTGHDVIAAREHVADALDARIDVFRALGELSVEDRCLVLRRFVEGVGLGEIARDLRSSRPAVCRKTRSLAARLRRRLDPEPPEAA